MITFRTNRLLSKSLCLPSLLSALLLLGACGSDNGESQPSSSSSSAPSSSSSSSSSSSVADAVWPEINVGSEEPKTLAFSWTPVEGATYYRLIKNPDGSSGYSQIGEDLTETSASDQISVHQHDWNEASYIIEACNDSGCESSEPVFTDAVMLDAIGYFKASNTNTNDWFGWSMALSADGSTLAVGASRESSKARGINGDQENNSVFGAGAVYVFYLHDGQWQQQAYIKASNTEQPVTDEDGTTRIRLNDRFGYDLALSDDGNTLAVSALLEDGNSTGINGDQENNVGTNSGAVYTFARTGSDWTQTAYIKASNTGAAPEETEEAEEESTEDEVADEDPANEVALNPGDRFGYRLALSGDGLTLAVSATGEASAGRGVNSDTQSDNTAPNAGAVYVFTLGDAGWSQQSYIKASNTEAGDLFGSSLALSQEGNRLAVGAIGEDSAATGVAGNQADNNATSAGAVYLFTRTQDSWTQEAYLKPSETYTKVPAQVQQRFGSSVAMSGDGNLLAVGAIGDLSRASGADADPADFDLSDPDTVALNSGATHIFSRAEGTWSQTAYLKASNSANGIEFGNHLALSSDGRQLLVTAWREDSSAKGVGEDQNLTDAPNSGAAYLFSLENNAWKQKAYLKAPNTGMTDGFGIDGDISAEGDTLGISAFREKSDATGINGDRHNDEAPYSGAAYLY